MIYIILLILLLLLIDILDKKSILKYTEPINKKTIILVVSQNVKGMGGYWGLGDIIRGMISTYQLTEKLDCNYIIDIQLHPISKFFKKNNHKYSKLIKENDDNIFFQSNIEEYIKNNNSDVIYFNTNNDIYNSLPISDNCKKYIKDILTPTDELSEYITTITKSIPYNLYNILHYRIGDEEILYNKNIDMTIYIDNFKKNKEENDILMSDSVEFKKIIKSTYNIYSFDFDIGHIGTEKNDIKIKNTLCEFFIMTKAHKIKTYSSYSWISTFVLVISKLYDIDVIDLKTN